MNHIILRYQSLLKKDLLKYYLIVHYGHEMASHFFAKHRIISIRRCIIFLLIIRCSSLLEISSSLDLFNIELIELEFRKFFNDILLIICDLNI